MHQHLLSGALALLLIPISATAQHANHGAPAAGSRAAAAPPAILSAPPRATAASHRYRRFDADEAMTDWHAANATVREIGGWRVYAREAARANQSVPTRSAETAPTPPPRGKQ